MTIPTHPRPLAERDLHAALDLVRAAAPPSHVEALCETVTGAAGSASAEARGLVAELEGTLAAIVVHGEYAGASGAGRLHLVVVAPHARRRGLGRLLVEAACNDLGAGGARFVLAELPLERPALAGYTAFLRALGFAEESRIEDFHRDGVPLVFLRRELRRSTESA